MDAIIAPSVGLLPQGKSAMFLDEVKIHVSSGKGGDGIVHFRREKYVPRGGPDGGDGGKGGDVLFKVNSHLNSLAPFRRRRHFRAGDGGRGGPQRRSGAAGEDVLLEVPAGTMIRDDEQGKLLADLVQRQDTHVLLKGGRGGRGNAHYASARNQAPRMAEKGEPGKEMWVRLELRLIADVGIVGVPNAGKSTLLAAISNARPKIAAYPFTTLVPNLGVVELPRGESMVVADIPGLIEGAHEGVGLGFSFLRHIQRTRAIIHVIDGAGEDPMADFSQVNSEMALFDKRLERMPQVIAISKIDLPQVRDRLEDLLSGFEDQGLRPLAISALARQGLEELIKRTLEMREKGLEPLVPDEEDLPVYRPTAEEEGFSVGRDPDGVLRVSGEAIERSAAMTYWEYRESVRRFQRLLERIGVERALRQAGIEEGQTVRIGEYELEWQE